MSSASSATPAATPTATSTASVSSTPAAPNPPGDAAAGGHDPNDDIAAAIAAVAAGESHLKMPSAAVEAEQVHLLTAVYWYCFTT